MTAPAAGLPRTRSPYLSREKHPYRPRRPTFLRRFLLRPARSRQRARQPGQARGTSSRPARTVTRSARWTRSTDQAATQQQRNGTATGKGAGDRRGARAGASTPQCPHPHLRERGPWNGVELEGIEPPSLPQVEARYRLRHSPVKYYCAAIDIDLRAVELGGFEPPTSSMPWKRATDCAIAPFSGVALSATGISVWSPRPPGKSVSRAVPHPPYPRTPVAVVPAGAGAQSGLRAQDRNPPSAPPAPEPFRSSPLFQCSSLHPGDRPVLPSIA